MTRADSHFSDEGNEAIRACESVYMMSSDYMVRQAMDKISIWIEKQEKDNYIRNGSSY